MDMALRFDSEYNVELPTLVLATKSGSKLGVLPATGIVCTNNMDSGADLVFKVYREESDETLWKKIKDFKLVWCREWDKWFEIYVEVDESDDRIKTVTGKSLCEAELSQINLYDIHINDEEDIEREADEETGLKAYDENYPTVLYRDEEEHQDASLLHRLMYKIPYYSIGHVDSTLWNIQRTFEFDGKSVYDAFQEIAEEEDILFVFDSGSDSDGKPARIINVYDLETTCLNDDCSYYKDYLAKGKYVRYRGEFTDVCPQCGSTHLSLPYGKDTTIFIDTDNLADDITYNVDTGSVKNCFKLTAGDDVMTAAVRNMNPNGTDYLWCLTDDFKSDMSLALTSALDKYDQDYDYYNDEYRIWLDAEPTSDFIEYADSLGEDEVANDPLYTDKVVEDYNTLQNKYALGATNTIYDLITGANFEFYEGTDVPGINVWPTDPLFYQYYVASEDLTVEDDGSIKVGYDTPFASHAGAVYYNTATRKYYIFGKLDSSGKLVYDISYVDGSADWQAGSDGIKHLVDRGYDGEYGWQVISDEEDFYNIIGSDNAALVPNPTVGYSKLIRCYYDVVNFYYYLKTSMMPDSTDDIDSTTAVEQAGIIIAELNASGVATTSLNNVSAFSAGTLVRNYAKALLDYRYEIKKEGMGTIEYTYEDPNATKKVVTSAKWIGNLTITNEQKEEDDESDDYTFEVTVDINSDMPTYTKQFAAITLKDDDLEDDVHGVVQLFELPLKYKYSEYRADDTISTGLSARGYKLPTEVADQTLPEAGTMTFDDAVKKYSLEELAGNDQGGGFISCAIACLVALSSIAGNPNSEEWVGIDAYNQYYVPYYYKLGVIEKEIQVRTAEVETIDTLQKRMIAWKDYINGVLDMKKYLLRIVQTTDETATENYLYNELLIYRREDEYKNDNYVSTDIDDDYVGNEELFRRAEQFIQRAMQEAYKSATLQHSITATVRNLLAMEEFEPLLDSFALGNYLRVSIDDEVYKLRLINYEIDFESQENISVEFSDVIHTVFGDSDVQSILQQAESMSSSYGAVIRQMDENTQSSKYVSNWIANGMDATLTKIVDSADRQSQVWDEHGMLFREYDNTTGGYNDEQMRIINSTIAITDDSWQTLATAVGKFWYQNPKTGEYTTGYGVNAEVLIGKLIMGEELFMANADGTMTFDSEGLEISSNIDGNNTVVSINPNDYKIFNIYNSKTKEPLLYVDEDGKLHLSGTVAASSDSTLSGTVDNVSFSSTGIQKLEDLYVNNFDATRVAAKLLEADSGTIGQVVMNAGTLTYYQKNAAGHDAVDEDGNKIIVSTIDLANGTLSLGDSSGEKLKWDGEELYVNGNGTFTGTVYATDGEFTGKITATEGTIGTAQIVTKDVVDELTGQTHKESYLQIGAGTVIDSESVTTSLLNAEAADIGDIIIKGNTITSETGTINLMDTLITPGGVTTKLIAADEADFTNMTVDTGFIKSLATLISTNASLFADNAYITSVVADNITVADLKGGNIVLSDSMKILSANQYVTNEDGTKTYTSTANQGLVMNGTTLQFLDQDGNPGIEIGYDPYTVTDETDEDGNVVSKIVYGTPHIIIKDSNGSTLINSQGISATDVGISSMIQTKSVEASKLAFDFVKTEDGTLVIQNYDEDDDETTWGQALTEFIGQTKADVEELKENGANGDIGARNYIRSSENLLFHKYYFRTGIWTDEEESVVYDVTDEYGNLMADGVPMPDLAKDTLDE